MKRLIIAAAVIIAMTAAMACGVAENGEITTPTAAPTETPAATSTSTPTPTPLTGAALFNEEALTACIMQCAEYISGEKYAEFTADLQKGGAADITEEMLCKAVTEIKTAVEDGMTPTVLTPEIVYNKYTAEAAVYIMYSENTGIRLDIIITPEIIINNLSIGIYSRDSEAVYTDVETTLGCNNELRGIITIPNNIKNAPVVVLVQGEDAFDADMTLADGRKPSETIAHELAARGIATVRYESRYYRYPSNIRTGDTVQEQTAADFTELIKTLSKDPRTCEAEIYPAGHGLSATVCLDAIIKNDLSCCDGYIILAGSARTYAEVLCERQIRALYSLNYEQAVIDAYKEMITANIALTSDIADMRLSAEVLGKSGYYWTALEQIDTPANALAYTGRVLVIHGSEDIEFYADTEYESWKTVLTKDNVKFVLIGGADHYFYTLSDEEYVFETKTADEIAGWILNK